ncbi:hypothetical protein BSL78_08596 [Apostichopus japonicus]|uniref:Protein kinase domain-containing protein n=1 Tax=Stichopus japonicus TaxID=307972 RepID=A0A2G8L2R1_STIJA|nr:hypothetical protein BSL78_08596 [Apostichopus japonicus]
MPDHANLLKTLGYCKSEGMLYLIQENVGVTSLEVHLLSDYANFDAVVDGTTLEDTLKYGLDIVNGMWFLSQQGCCHPFLSIKWILVDNYSRCKLYNFCPVEDAQSVLTVYITKDEEPSWLLPPESRISREYTTSSDVWAIGIAFWEIFHGVVKSCNCVLHIGLRIVHRLKMLKS